MWLLTIEAIFHPLERGVDEATIFYQLENWSFI